ncbi:MAG: 2-amino-4-hydroxy-6-hydroxymethyldihydropteridine diphosphokinase [Dehalococcoidia bacterium]
MVEERRCLLGLGSNLGNRLANLQEALRRLEPDVRVVAVSSLYESDPVGPSGQPAYLNAVAEGMTALEPHPLLRRIKQIEWELGRRPGPRWGPRPADLDILFIDGLTLDAPDLTIPHIGVEERPFVLVPLAEVAPDLLLNSGRTARRAAAAADQSGQRRVAEPMWRDTVSVFPPTIPSDSART